MLALIIFIVAAQGSVLPSDSCRGVRCRPGRECVQLQNHQTECLCQTKCPDHWKPVCGSDGVSYDNHCELHRRACVDGRSISPLHSGFCKGEREALIAREEFIEEISQLGDYKKTPLPMVCLENDRNRLREFLISWLNLSSSRQPWYRHGISYSEILSGHFTAMDKNGDGHLDSQEMYKYISRNNSQSSPKSKADRIRELCLDALVEEGDVNMDWRLGYSEYKEILQHDYQPSIQVCKMNGRVHSDGAETSVQCNGCICGCGKWVCTANKCTQGFSEVNSNKLTGTGGVDVDKSTPLPAQKQSLDYDSYSDDDDDDYVDEDEDDGEDPEDDPDVADINWF